MDRQAFTTGQLVPNSQLLGMEKEKLVALGYALEAIMGAGGTVVSGLACTPTTSPSLSVVVGRGSIMTTTAIDGVAYSDLGTDSNATIKQGILQEPGVTLTLTPPSTAGYSQVYLIQASQSDVDSTTVVPFYNASNPAQPYNGPSNSGNATLTLRQSKCVVSLKAGAAAATGSQVTPSADTGNVGLYTITLVNGQTTIQANQIAQLASAPFVPVTLPGVPAGVQAGQWTYGVDTGAAGALVETLSPAPTSLPDGMSIRVKAAHAASGSDTLNVNGTGALPIRRRGGLVPAAGDWAAGDVLPLVKVGSTWQVGGLLPSDVSVTILTRPAALILWVDPTNGSDSNDGSLPGKAYKTIDAAIGKTQSYSLFIYLLGDVTWSLRQNIYNNVQVQGVSADASGNITGYVTRGITFLNEATNSPVSQGRCNSGAFFYGAAFTFDHCYLTMPDQVAGGVVTISQHFLIQNGGTISVTTSTVATAGTQAGSLINSPNSQAGGYFVGTTISGNAVGHLFYGVAAGVNPNNNAFYRSNLTSA